MRGRWAAGVALAGVLATAACSGASAPAKHVSPTSATRWWSNSAVGVGSTLAPGATDAAATRLHPSRTQYCTMLRQTVAAGRSVLTGASGRAATTATTAFVAEVQAVAPTAIAPSWRTLGPALVTVAHGGTLSSSAAVQQAGAAIAADAKSACHLDLAS